MRFRTKSTAAVAVALACCVAAVVALDGSAAKASSQLRARYTVIRMRHPVGYTTLAAESLAGNTVRAWFRNVRSQADGGTYGPWWMVGKDPFVDWSARTPSQSSSWSVGVDIIPVKFDISTYTFDPEAATSGCTTQTPVSLVMGSPVFGTHDYTMNGVDVGTHQYVGAFQRAEFVNETVGAGAINPDYDVVLKPVVRPEITVDASSYGAVLGVPGSCPYLGAIDMSTWNSYVSGTLLPQLEAAWNPGHGNLDETTYTRLPLFVFTNVVMYQGDPDTGCCILGYHSAASEGGVGGGTQTYSVADYESTGYFGSGTSDISPVSHEIAEWMDDPFGSNVTPAWGHTGQVSGCQANLEVGDPLSGTPFAAVTMPNGVTYHPQELAFVSWFFRPNLANGWYAGAGGDFSDNGTFTTNAGAVCS